MATKSQEVTIQFNTYLGGCGDYCLVVVLSLKIWESLQFTTFGEMATKSHEVTIHFNTYLGGCGDYFHY